MRAAPSLAEALAAAALALAWLHLEPRLEPPALVFGQAPDGLLLVAVGLARAARGRPRAGAVLPAAALGALRDLLTGGARGVAALGYAAAARLAQGRAPAPLAPLAAAGSTRGAGADTVLGGALEAALLAPLAHLPGALALAWSGAAPLPLARALLGLALATGLAAPAVLAPLALARRLGRGARGRRP